MNDTIQASIKYLNGGYCVRIIAPDGKVYRDAFNLASMGKALEWASEALAAEAADWDLTGGGK